MPTHACLSLSVCLCVCLVSTITKNNGSIHLKLENNVDYKISRTSSTLGIVRSRSRARHDFEIFLHLPQCKLSSPISYIINF